MSEWIRLLLSLTVSASIVALVLFALKPLYRERLSKTWQYYVWLIVVFRLILPFAPETNLMRLFFNRVEIQSAATSEQAAESLIQPAETFYPEVHEEQITPDTEAFFVQPQERRSVEIPEKRADSSIMQHLWILWLIPALVLFVRKLTSYHSFVRYIKAGRKEVFDEETLSACQRACEKSGVRRIPPIYQNELVSSPMLVGIVKPYIVLPALDLDFEGMQNVLCHELTHYKRGDILYKWLVQLVVCIHWFNPLVYLISREVSRNCELSCDESVLAGLTRVQHQQYGDTLLVAMKGGGSYSGTVASVTLTEEGTNMKERLQAILKYRPGSRATKICAVALSAILLCGAAYAGAYAGFSKASAGTAYTGDAVITLSRQRYQHLATANTGSSSTAQYQTDGAHTALYISQDGAGQFDLIIHDAAGKVALRKSGITFAASQEPVLVFSGTAGAYTLELNNPTKGPASVAVYGAALNEAGEYTTLSLPRILGDVIAEEISNNIGRRTSTGSLESRIEAWADRFAEDVERQVEDWVMGWTDQWVDGWAERWIDWGEKWADQWGNTFNGESWRYLNYRYENGYLVGAGIRHNDDLNNYSRTETVSINGFPWTVAFPAEYEQYAENDMVMNLIQNMIEKRSPSVTQSDTFFTVRSIDYNTDREQLLREVYSAGRFIEFSEMAGHCKDMPVIEELLYRAFDDDESLCFVILAENLPADFSGADDLAKQIADKGDIIMLSGLERFLPSSTYEGLMHKAIGLD